MDYQPEKKKNTITIVSLGWQAIGNGAILREISKNI